MAKNNFIKVELETWNLIPLSLGLHICIVDDTHQLLSLDYGHQCCMLPFSKHMPMSIAQYNIEPCYMIRY